MCLGMNGDTVDSGKLSVSTSSRNFEGRQGKGSSNHTREAACCCYASAIEGKVADPRKAPS